ncbi:MAG: DUF3667 domain-containing protein [Planctomycetota bacterium]
MSENTSSETPRSDTRGNCAECGNSIEGVAFCPICGQDAKVGPLKFSVMLTGFFTMLTGLEFPLLRTSLDLLWRPGFVAAAWIRGKRRTYASPIKFSLVTGVVVTLGIRMVVGELTIPNNGVSGFERFLVVAATNYFAFFAMGLLLPLAILMGLMSRLLGVTRSMLEWYALGLYVIGISVALQVFCGAVVSILPGIKPLSGMIPIIYFLLGAWGFSHPGERWRSIATCVLGFVSLFSVALLIQYALR